MLEHHGEHDPLAALSPVTDADTIRRCVAAVRRVFVHAAIKDYLVAVVNRTRQSSDIRLGASPRASLQLLRAAKARAAMSGRHYVTPDDIAELAVPTLAHRVLLSGEAQLARLPVAEAIGAALRSVPIPDGRR